MEDLEKKISSLFNAFPFIQSIARNERFVVVNDITLDNKAYYNSKVRVVKNIRLMRYLDHLGELNLPEDEKASLIELKMNTGEYINFLEHLEGLPKVFETFKR